MAKIEIYTKAFCPFCVRAKALFKKKNAAFTDIPAYMDSALRAEMRERAGGANTFPQIFIDGKHIGGCDELVALDARGGLDPLLAG
ncbi:MAG: glutaredoxin 3 [Maricaulaceae bacterium]